jgi:hypothetical protein
LNVSGRDAQNFLGLHAGRSAKIVTQVHVGSGAPPSSNGYTVRQLMRIAWKAAIVVAALAPAPRAAAAAAACQADSDCVLVSDDCCGCTGGGKQRALRKKDRAGYERARQARCAGTLCAAVMSQDPSCAATSAVCKEDKCTLGL